MYCEVEDLLLPTGFFTQTELEQLSSVEGEAIELHSDRIEAKIIEQSEYIDVFLRGRYKELPLLNAPTLKTICIHLVSYDLASARYRKNTDPKIIEKYEKANTLLTLIQEGKVVVQQQDRETIVSASVIAPEPTFDLDKF